MKLGPAIAFAVLLSIPAFAEKDVNKADYPLTAHVDSAVVARISPDAHSRTTELHIGKLIYVASTVCKEARVGSDFAAQVEGKKIKLLINDKKVCTYRISGTKDAKQQ